jgi:D-beta-D-heptose 7-phosphate kinase / D-beta-D-heptose 1-phosphate adenosyltransferase
MDHEKVKKIVDKIKREKPKILVIGDIILDEYVTGKVKRISPEAPVAILDYENEKIVLGGVGNVVNNLNNFGSEVTLATIVGDDLDGTRVMNLLKNINISISLTSISKNINTTKKTRFTNQGTQLLRLDNDSKGFQASDFITLKKKVIGKVSEYDCLIISDYNKGVCEKSIIENLIKNACQKNIPVFIDPKGSNWSKYLNATCLTPNKKEVEGQLKLKLKNDADFENAARILIEKFNLEYCLITRGADGMTFIDKNTIIHQKVDRKEVYDVSGAGDTVISCLAALLSSGVSMNDSIKVSSHIASEVVAYRGTVPFDKKMFELNE